MEAQNHALLCQEIESELRELCLECRKRLPSIKEYTERAILKIRHHRDLVEKAGGDKELPEFPLHEVLKSILMACETFQSKIVLLSLSCLQRLIHRRVLKDETIAIVINLMNEQARNGDEQVQLKVLQTIMATPSHMTLVNELVVEQLLQLLYVLHNSTNVSVHHTACAGLRQLAESLSDRAAQMAKEAPEYQVSEREQRERLRQITPTIQQAPAPMPTMTPVQSPVALSGPLRMMYIFVQDLCVMADYDHSGLSSRYAQDAGERMRTGSREGYWLAAIKFPRPLCLELLGTSVAAHPEVFLKVPQCFELLRHAVCTVLLKNLRGCFDFAIMIRSIHLLQQILQCPGLAEQLIPELQVFLHLMLDFTKAESSPWQRATSLEFLKSICENASVMEVIHKHGSGTPAGTSAAIATESGPRTFVELVNGLSKLMHQVCFSAGMDSSQLLPSSQRGTAGGNLIGGPTSTFAGGSAPSDGGSVGGAGRLSSGSGSGRREPSGNSSSVATVSALPRVKRLKLLLLMTEAEPPAIQTSFLVSLVVDCVFAIVSTLFRLLNDANGVPLCDSSEAPISASPTCGNALSGSEKDGPLLLVGNPGQSCLPLADNLTDAQERCRGMAIDSWASVLSALSLLLNFTADEAFLHQALRCVQTLLYCCSSLGLEQARDACLLQVSKYALPGQNHDDSETGISSSGYSSSTTSAALSAKNVMCFKALLNFCYCYGALLGVGGWTIALRAFDGLEKVLQKASPVQAQELAALRHSLDSLFETTVLLPEVALKDIVCAFGDHIRSQTDSACDGAVLNRLVELCTFNLARLLSVWASVLRIILDTCSSDQRGDFRAAAAAALCRILGLALRKGALALSEDQENCQEELLRPLEALLQVSHEDARARVCEGLLAILQASGQELQPAAWGTVINLVEMAARVELQRAGVEFYLPRSVDTFSPASDPREQEVATDTSSESSSRRPGRPSSQGLGIDGRDAAHVLTTVFALLELIVHDFMEYAPPGSVQRLTASIGAFARFGGLGVNSSLTAVGFLWNVADALALYHCSGKPNVLSSVLNGAESRAPAMSTMEASETGSRRPDELWVQIFMHLRVLAVDSRPEVRNCAVKSLSSALLSHGRKVGTACYQRCLRDILIQVLAEIQAATERARKDAAPRTPEKDGGCKLVHHSRDTLEKQWDETMVLGIENVRRVLSHFAEEASVASFAPLAYTLLLQIQRSLQASSAEVSTTALRALVDLMRTPASSQAFNAAVTVTISPLLPAPANGSSSVWLLGWSVLWRMVSVCAEGKVSEQLMEAFASTLGMLQGSHRHLFTPPQHAISLQLAFVLVTSPSFYLASSTPFQEVSEAGTTSSAQAAGDADSQGHGNALPDGVRACASLTERLRGVGAPGSAHSSEAEDQQVFAFVESSPEALWRWASRVQSSSIEGYSKATVPIKCFVDVHQSQNLEVRSMENLLQAACQESEPLSEEALRALLGPERSPTHRTMLHTSSAKLTPSQSGLFSLLESAHFSEPMLEVLFLCQLCAVCLDLRRVLADANKLALAARTLVVLVVFCRRLVLRNLASLLRVSPGAAKADFAATPDERALAKRHLEAFIGAVPHLCRVVSAVACGRGGVRESGLWKLAIEALLYIIEDSLLALERCSFDKRLTDAYWASVMDTLDGIVASVVPGGSQQASGDDHSDVLFQAVGTLIIHRLLSSTAAPAEASKRAVKLLGTLVGFQSDVNSSAGRSVREHTDRAALGHLFDLCAQPEDPAQASSSQVSQHSVAVMSARSRGAPLTPVRLVDRPALLSLAVPALLARVRALLTAFAEDAGRQEPLPGAAARLEVVRFVLSRLRALCVDPEEFLVAAPSISGKARAACELAGPQGLAMALLPQLGAIASAGDPQVCQDVRKVLEALSSELGLTGEMAPFIALA